MATDGYARRWNGIAYPAEAERLSGSPLLMPGPSGEPFSARSGRRVGGAGLGVTVGGSPESVTVASGAGVIYDSNFAASGPWDFSLPTAKTIQLPARPATGQSRIDLVVARIYDSDSGAGAVKELKIEHVPGSPASSPSAPALPALSLELARLTVPASGSITVTPSSRRAVAAGGVLPVATTAERDLIASPWAGLTVYNAQTTRLEFYNGTAWGPVSTARQTEAGNASVSCPNANTVYTAAVTFPTPFPAGVTPVVTLGVLTGAPQARQASFNNPTNTGFTLVGYSTVASQTVQASYIATTPS